MILARHCSRTLGRSATIEKDLFKTSVVSARYPNLWGLVLKTIDFAQLILSSALYSRQPVSELG